MRKKRGGRCQTGRMTSHWTRSRRNENNLEAAHDMPSDNTLVYSPGNDDLNDIEVSSDTVFDEHALVGPKRAETRKSLRNLP